MPQETADRFVDGWLRTGDVGTFDPEGNLVLIGRLSDLLRASLRAHDAPQVPLREELALLGAYVELMKARFGERLTVTMQIDPGLDDVPVPPLSSRKLVEVVVSIWPARRSPAMPWNELAAFMSRPLVQRMRSIMWMPIQRIVLPY